MGLFPSLSDLLLLVYRNAVYLKITNVVNKLYFLKFLKNQSVKK